MPSGLPTVNSYVTAPSIPPYHPPTQVSPYMGYSATTSAYVTGPTWQPASGSALSPHSCDLSPLAFKSMAASRDAIHQVAASVLWGSPRRLKTDRGSEWIVDFKSCFTHAATLLWTTQNLDPLHWVQDTPPPPHSKTQHSKTEVSQGVNAQHNKLVV